MPDEVKIQVEGIDKVRQAFNKFPSAIAKNMSQAGHEAATTLIDTKGLRKYPPATAANRPPTPFYIRGRGMQLKSRNLGNSERLGTRWYIKKQGWTVTIGNTASYAPFVHGDKTQASFMASKGWRKLFETAQSKKKQIQTVYQKWVNKTIKELGL